MKVWRINVISPEEENKRLLWEGFADKESLSLEWKSEGVMDDESGESMELMEEVFNVYEYIGWSDVTESMVKIRSPFCGYNMAYNVWS